MSTDFTLPEVAEVDASDDIAALYETIRVDTGSRLVNYVWRHLATIDGAAPWLWETTRSNDHRPLAAFLGSTADASAFGVAAATRPSARIAMCPTAREIVAVYNVNNIGNLSRAMMLLESLRRPPGEAEAAAHRGGPQAEPTKAGAELPPLPRFSDLAEEDLAAIAVVSEAGPAADSGIVPSLWRHIAIEPGLIRRLRDPLVAALVSPEFASAFDRLRSRGLAQAAETPLVLPPPADFDRAAATEGLDRFLRRIAELCLAGRILAEWTSAAFPSPAFQRTLP